MAESYGVTQETGGYENLFAGSFPRVELPITLKSGAGSLKRGAPLGLVETDLPSEKYKSINPGTAYTEEDRGDGNSSTKTFSGTLAHPGVKPDTLRIYAVVVGGATETFTDNGDGTLTSDGATPGSGTIIYATGAYSVTFFVAPLTGEDVLADYTGALTAYVDEAVGTGTSGGQKEWSGALAHTKVIPGSVRFYTNDTTPLVAHDDGAGNIIGDAVGFVNYDTGVYDITFETAPADTKTVKVEYCTTDGSGILRCILGRDSDATSADVKTFAWFTGEFRREGLEWPAAVSEAQKTEIAREARERGIFIKADLAA